MPKVSRGLSLFVSLVLLVLLPCFQACGQTDGAQTDGAGGAGVHQLIVGFSQVGAESDWRAAETRSIRDEATRRGIQLKFSDAQGNQAMQIAALRGFLRSKVDAILLAPKVETGWGKILRDAKKAGVPVVLVDRGIVKADRPLVRTLIASDFVEEGRMAARELVRLLGGKGGIVELEGTPGSAPAVDRHRGFQEVLKKHPLVQVLLRQTGDFTRAKGKAVMEAFLKSKGDAIRGVYAHNDDMALGAIQALKELGRKPGRDVFIVSIDGVRAAFQAMERGELNATVECNPLLGPLAFDAIEKILRGDEVPKTIVVKDRLFTQAMAESELPKRKY